MMRIRPNKRGKIAIGHRVLLNPHDRRKDDLWFGIAVLVLSCVYSVCIAYGDNGNSIILRTSVEPKQEIWVGQRVIMQVDVLVRDGWGKIKKARDFEVPGALVVRLQTQGDRLNETIEGRAYSGQRYELSLFPQRGGTIAVPSVPVEVELKRWGSPAVDTSQRLNTPSVEFEVKVPLGTGNLPGLISTTQLEVQQNLEPDAREFKVGDAIKRTILLKAPDISGMAFTPIKFPSIDGLGVYPAEPSGEDSYYRGSLTGKRREMVTYVFEREGTFELPEIVIKWWDLKNEQLKEAVLPALVLQIASTDLTKETITDGEFEHGRSSISLWFLYVIIILAAASGTIWRFRRNFQYWWQTWKYALNETEKAYFHRFIKASRSGDSKNALNALMGWLDRIHTGAGAARLDRFLQDFGDEEARVEAYRLVQSLASEENGKWNEKALADRMKAARRRWRLTKRRTGTYERLLPPLNP